MADDYLRLVKPWRMGEARMIAHTRIFDLKELHGASPTTAGKEGDFVFLDSVDWVNVIAVTPDEQVVMIEQYRHGLGEVTLEVPGGMVDDDESPADACRRELAEESGYVGTAAEIIGCVSPNPAIQNNRCYTGLVREAVLGEQVDFDSHEEIAVRLVDLKEVPDLIRRGVIHHALVMCAFHHFSLLRGE
jgi:8-oxo-dGTP pyrophosphatase MutT (NUDIX family)